MFHSLRRRLSLIGKWPRLCAAGICLLLALTSAVGAKRSGDKSAASLPVVVAAHSLPAGHTLTRGDLTVARWPSGLRPGNARADPADALGQRLAGPVAAREPITASRLVGRDLMSGLTGGLVAAPVTLDDPHGADLVHAGDRVDLLEAPRAPQVAEAAASVPPQISVVASRALVLAVLPGRDGAAAELVLAVDRATAVRITRDRPGQTFTAIGDPP
jgi:Flp pilus assembly protein CpaB